MQPCALQAGAGSSRVARVAPTATRPQTCGGGGAVCWQTFAAQTTSGQGCPVTHLCAHCALDQLHFAVLLRPCQQVLGEEVADGRRLPCNCHVHHLSRTVQRQRQHRLGRPCQGAHVLHRHLLGLAAALAQLQHTWGMGQGRRGRAVREKGCSNPHSLRAESACSRAREISLSLRGDGAQRAGQVQPWPPGVALTCMARRLGAPRSPAQLRRTPPAKHAGGSCASASAL